MSTTKGVNVAVYLRVSTGGQSVANQRLELEDMAKRAGWTIFEVYRDKGISGAKGRNGRPELDRMLNDATRRRFKKLLVWDLSRLGRSRANPRSLKRGARTESELGLLCPGGRTSTTFQ